MAVAGVWQSGSATLTKRDLRKRLLQRVFQPHKAGFAQMPFAEGAQEPRETELRTNLTESGLQRVFQSHKTRFAQMPFAEGCLLAIYVESNAAYVARRKLYSNSPRFC